MTVQKKMDWSDFKNNITNRSGGSLQHFETTNSYSIFLFDGPLTLECLLPKADTTNVTDFVNNYQSLSNKSIDQKVSTVGVSDSFGRRARLVGTHFDTVVPNSTKNIDFKIPQLQYPPGTNVKSVFNGVEYYAGNATVGDTAFFSVVDKDQVYYPTETTLDEFASTWYIMPDCRVPIILYRASLIPNLYLRVKYTNTSLISTVKFVCNLFRHIEP